MRKNIITTLLLSSVLVAGCGNNEVNSGNGSAPEQTAQAATAAPAATETAEPVMTPAATAEATMPAATPETATETSPVPDESMRQVYFDKLEAIEAGLKDLKALSDEGTTASMTEAATKEYERWDIALNEIYQVLIKQLPEDDMNKLREEQRNWIKERDAAADQAAKQYEGGTMAGLEYAATLAGVTKERSYKLVEMYMK